MGLLTDMKKVEAELDAIVDECRVCDYVLFAVVVEHCTNILSMLKEQETHDTGESRVFQCEKCGYGIEDIFLSSERDYPIIPVYCPNCGRLVKRDD